MRFGCTFTSRESRRSKAPSSSRPSSAGDRSTGRSQLRPRMSKSSLILNQRAGTQTSRRAARLTSAGAVSQTGQNDSKRDQRQIACHRLLRANATRRHCLRKVTQKDRSYVSELMRPLLCSCGSTMRIEIHYTISSIIEYNPLTSTYELKCMYQRYRGLTSWTEPYIRSPRQWIELLTEHSNDFGPELP